MQTLAGASGATLGYILGDLPGAYYGYKLGRRMAPMYPTPRSKRTRYASSRSSRSRSYSTRSRSGVTSGSKMSYASRLGSESIVTRQHDYGKQYRYKKMPRYKKRRWRKFINRVQAVQLKQAGLRTVVFNNKFQCSNGAGFQFAVGLGLYGVNGTLDQTGFATLGVAGFRDLYRIFRNDPDIEQTGVPPGNIPKSGKLQFGSGVLDVTLRNLSADIEIELDVYYGWFKKDSSPSGALINDNPVVEFQNAPVDLVNTGNTAIGLDTRGATLFDKPSGISDTGYHITKKFKMILAPGQSTFLQHRDAKNYMVDWTNVSDCSYARKGLTFGMWLLFKPSVTASDDAVATLGVGCTRKYSYAVVEDNIDRIAYNLPP